MSSFPHRLHPALWLACVLAACAHGVPAPPPAPRALAGARAQLDALCREPEPADGPDPPGDGGAAPDPSGA